jgi:hypothetical protein
MNDEAYLNVVERHWTAHFGEPVRRVAPMGPRAGELPKGMCILEFGRRWSGDKWRYATVGMSLGLPLHVELYMRSMCQDDGLAMLLVAVAHYHRTGALLDWGHTVNFGVGWQLDSKCDHGLIVAPHMDGPLVRDVPGTDVAAYWLMPVTASEVAFKAAHGVDPLEERFQQARIHADDPHRTSVV